MGGKVKHSFIICNQPGLPSEFQCSQNDMMRPYLKKKKKKTNKTKPNCNPNIQEVDSGELL